MAEPLQEYCDSRGVRMRVDRESGVIRGVKILGLKSRNGRSYLPEALRQAAALYENAKVNVNHPKGHPAAPRDYQDRLGQIRGVELRPGEGLFGDLHFNPKHALAEQLAWDAEHAPENVGFSHNVEARATRRGEEVVVEAITRVQSVDLVADPATTRGLFESLGDGGATTTPTTIGGVVAGPTSGSGKEATAVPQPPRLTLEELQSFYPELIEELGRRQNAEIECLQAEIERLSAAQSRKSNREVIRRLLREYRLPDLDSDDPVDRAIIGEEFLELLLDAEDEEHLRPMIAQRATFIEAVRNKLFREKNATVACHHKPVSRDQNLASEMNSSNAKTFVEAIT